MHEWKSSRMNIWWTRPKTKLEIRLCFTLRLLSRPSSWSTLYSSLVSSSECSGWLSTFASKTSSTITNLTMKPSWHTNLTVAYCKEWTQATWHWDLCIMPLHHWQRLVSATFTLVVTLKECFARFFFWEALPPFHTWWTISSSSLTITINTSPASSRKKSWRNSLVL